MAQFHSKRARKWFKIAVRETSRIFASEFAEWKGCLSMDDRI
jgi:hypothetical protein